MVDVGRLILRFYRYREGRRRRGDFSKDTHFNLRVRSCLMHKAPVYAARLLSRVLLLALTHSVPIQMARSFALGLDRYLR